MPMSRAVCETLPLFFRSAATRNSFSKPSIICFFASANGKLPFAEAKKSMIENFEREFLVSALRKNDGNVSQTARDIGMVRQSLQQKIRELGLRSESLGSAPASQQAKGENQ